MHSVEWNLIQSINTTFGMTRSFVAKIAKNLTEEERKKVVAATRCCVIYARVNSI